MRISRELNKAIQAIRNHSDALAQHYRLYTKRFPYFFVFNFFTSFENAFSTFIASQSTTKRYLPFAQGAIAMYYQLKHLYSRTAMQKKRMKHELKPQTR